MTGVQTCALPIFSHLFLCLYRSSACAGVLIYIRTSPDLKIFDAVIRALFTRVLPDLNSTLFNLSWMTLYGSLRLYRALVSAFLLNLMIMYLYSNAASAGATLAKRRNCTDGGGGAAAVTFT